MRFPVGWKGKAGLVTDGGLHRKGKAGLVTDDGLRWKEKAGLVHIWLQLRKGNP